MEIYLVNDQHGKKIAYDFKEAEQDKTYGWVQVSKQEFFTVNKASPSEEKENSEREMLIQQYMDKFGKMPDGRLSMAKIQATLDKTDD